MLRTAVAAGLLALGALAGASCAGSQDDAAPDAGITPHPQLLRVVPDPEFQPALCGPPTVTFSPSSLDPYLDGTFVVEGPAPVIQLRVTIQNTSTPAAPDGGAAGTPRGATDAPDAGHASVEVAGDLDMVVLVVWLNDPSKFVLGAFAATNFLGANFSSPSPAMLDEADPLYDPDPYHGFVTYVPVGPLPAGRSVGCDVLVAAAWGTRIHLEAVGQLADGRWAVTEPRYATTVQLTNGG